MFHHIRLADRLKEIADEQGTTPATLAVAWVLCIPEVTGAIVGARNIEHVKGWLPAARLELDELKVRLDDLAEPAETSRIP